MSDTNERRLGVTQNTPDEPAAWGVLRVGGSWVAILANEVQAETSRRSWDARENWVHEAVPLYRERPSLTQDEQWSLAQAILAYDLSDDDAACAKIAADLRALMDRFK